MTIISKDKLIIPFASLRIRGIIEDNGKWIPSAEEHDIDYVDINISKEEAERITNFLSTALKGKE